MIPSRTAFALVASLVLIAISTAGCGLIQRSPATTTPPTAAQPPPIAQPGADAVGQPGPAEQPTQTPTPLPSSAPTATATRTPTSTPAPVLRRLTEGGCCTQPFWSPDSRHVLFIDRPNPDDPAAIWGVDVTQPGAQPQVFLDRVAYYSRDLRFLSYPEGQRTVIERRVDGQRWTIDNGGRPVSFSPDLQRIAWEVSQEQGPFNERRTEVWLANLDGTEARRLTTVLGGGLAGWLPDGRLLLSGRPSPEENDRVLFILSPDDGQQVELAQAQRLSRVSVSPGGAWITYGITFDQDASRNGVWVIRPDGTGRRKLDLSTGAQWRDASHLVYVPLRASATDSHEFWEVDVATGQTRRLTDPAVTRFSISQGDWALSPDGHWVAFVNSQDRNLWLVELNEHLKSQAVQGEG